MRKLTIHYIKSLITLLFGIAVAVFWAVPYMSALSYQEQFQMFLYGSEYFIERVTLPGGLADYVSEFLVQFYYMPSVGAVIIALLFAAIQRTVWAVMRQMGAADRLASYLLSFVPVVALWCHLGNENVLLSFPVALLGALAAAWLYGRIRRPALMYTYIYIGVGVVYWLFGPVVFVFVLLVAASIIKRGVEHRNILGAVGQAVCIFIVTVAWMLLLTYWLQYPLYSVFLGINYFRYPSIVPFMQFAIMAVFVLVPMLSMVSVASPALQRLQQSTVAVVSAYIVFVALSVAAIKWSFNPAVYDIIEYEYLVRKGDWDKIIRKAEHTPATTPLSVACVNLALAQKNQLADRMFDFYQNGGEGLFPQFSRDMLTSVVMSEIFFRLGMVNDAERCAFEGQEAIQNYRKSCRLTRRLAECELINGNYKVAEKWLRLLARTQFYSAWAERTIAMLGNEKAINSHPMYGVLRKIRLDGDFLFSDTEIDKICGQLVMRDKGNAMAVQYLLMYPLLNRDINSFMNYYGYVNSVMVYNPVICQEAVAFAYMQQGMQIPQNIVGGDVMRRFQDFARTYTAAGKDSPQLEIYRNTLWYYLMKDKK